jgi:N6-L-threonylcarbamoyladenine synthase
MKILSIETSCDETALSIVEVNGSTVTFLANALISQVDIHSAYGGVFPVLAKREHQKNLTPLLKQVLTQAGMNVSKSPSPTNEDIVAILAKEKELAGDLLPFLASLQTPPIDIISVTYGPGLEPALWVGINCARALSLAWDIPIVPSNHMEGHILISLLGQEKEKTVSAPATRYTLHTLTYPALAPSHHCGVGRALCADLQLLQP